MHRNGGSHRWTESLAMMTPVVPAFLRGTESQLYAPASKIEADFANDRCCKLRI